jgi:hypothetical protein
MSCTKNPHTVFIVPYRDREEHKKLFLETFEKIKKHNQWSDCDVKEFFIHQCDERLFNRGAMKNIGFLFIKNLYPDTYKDITIVFHDVDTLPCSPDLLPYKTTSGVVTHYYGYKWCLGGIVVIKAGDFEKVGGFPNFWGWGLEDNCLYNRCVLNNLTVDRSIFFEINDKKILRPFDGMLRKISNRESYIYKAEGPDTLFDISKLQYQQEHNMVNVSLFHVPRDYTESEMYNYDIRRGSRIRPAPGYFRKEWKMNLF